LCAVWRFATLKGAMRRSHLPLGIAGLVCALAVAGCGTASTPAVELTLTAPTDGAVVSGGWVEVFGSVSPATAKVDVSGKPASGAGGAFRRRLDLRRGVTDIRVVATAPGYVPTSMHLAVRSEPAPAKKPTAITVSQFIATMNNLCIEGQAQLEVLAVAQVTGRISLTGLDAQLTRYLTRVKAVVPPRAIAGAWASYVALLEHEIDVDRQFIDAFKAREVTTARRLAAETKAIEIALSEKAEPLGLYACEPTPTR
jgi:NAD(P)-dependent dehydrogenase (short-subunit alcohol dehydrogenase family)